MQNYHTAKLSMPEYFRAELGHFMSIMRSNITQYIQNIGVQSDVMKPLLYFPLYRWIRMIMSSSSKPEHVLPVTLFLCNCTWWPGQTIFCSHVKHLDWRDCFLIIYLSQSKKIRRMWIVSHLGMCTPTPRTHKSYQWMHWLSLSIY